ncbi:MAG: enoyl-CoA hydratase/isomerase family protein [Actinomycetota bacterium]|jgi:enoyl-CoA hydratase/carnithine racemase|nr:enoyl-CoA hydratase/isomerase family protein [Actinomycetota bacterium]
MNEPHNPLVLRSDRDGVSTLTLNRPEALNALSPLMFEELQSHLDHLATNSSEVGVVILTGKGRSFSAGNDLKAIERGERASTPHQQAETLDLIEALPQPVIASVNGHCYTGALELVLACDLLICADDARFCDTHGKWGMVPTWGMTSRLPERVGPLIARDMMYSGRVVEGHEAARIGLANRSLPSDQLAEATAAWADLIAANSWHTLSHEKHQMKALAEFGRDDGLKWAREKGPGAASDMVERIQGGFKR